MTLICALQGPRQEAGQEPTKDGAVSLYSRCIQFPLTGLMKLG